MLAYQHILAVLGERDWIREERKTNKLKNNNSVNNNLELIITSICGAVAGIFMISFIVEIDFFNFFLIGALKEFFHGL